MSNLAPLKCSSNCRIRSRGQCRLSWDDASPLKNFANFAPLAATAQGRLACLMFQCYLIPANSSCLNGIQRNMIKDKIFWCQPLNSPFALRGSSRLFRVTDCIASNSVCWRAIWIISSCPGQNEIEGNHWSKHKWLMRCLSYSMPDWLICSQVNSDW